MYTTATQPRNPARLHTVRLASQGTVNLEDQILLFPPDDRRPTSQPLGPLGVSRPRVHLHHPDH